jgi:hypothetical protein
LIQFIDTIITTYGPRLAGSEAEKGAQLYVKSELEKFGSHVSFQPFKAALGAKFRKMKIYAGLYWLSVAVFFFNPYAALALAILNAVVTYNDLMRNNTLLDFLFPVQESANVTAIIEPTGTATSTLVFSGHMDSTEECQWWYWLKGVGAYLTFGCGILIVLYPVFVLAAILFPAISFLNWFFIIVSPVQLVYFTFHSSKVVPGASDNLSGVAIAFHTAKYFAENPLKNTRVRVISFGAEEKGLRGSKAYVAANLAQLKEEKAQLVNIDTIRVSDSVSLVNREPMANVVHSKDLEHRLTNSFANNNYAIPVNALPMGGTDAVPFSKNGIPAISIIGVPSDKLDPTYHTRLDTVDMIEPQALERVKNALIDFARTWDEPKS